MNNNKFRYNLEWLKITGLLVWFVYNSANWIFSPKYQMPVVDALLIRLSQLIAGYIVISIFYYIFGVLLETQLNQRKILIFLFTPFTIIACILWNISSNIIGWIMGLYSFTILGNYFLLGSLFFLIPILTLFILFFGVNSWKNFMMQKEKTILAVNLANEAQLKMLRYQINPHFLFNALNTIRYMIDEDKEVARKMITEFSDYFRYSLQNNKNEDTLENEINAIRNYLEIQQIRFEEKLKVDLKIECNAISVKLPFFIILPLIENAIKYGLQTSKMPMELIVDVQCSKGLVIKVCNTGKLINSPLVSESTKTGLENIKQRLELSFKNAYSFSLNEEKGWVKAIIEINDNSIFGK